MKKRILSVLLAACLAVGLLPVSALAANTVQVSDYNSLRSALTASSAGTIVQLTDDITYSAQIAVSSSLTVDLNGHTLTFSGTDTERRSLLTGIRFTGSGTFTVKDSGTDGELTASETYSTALANAGSGTLELQSGAVTADQEMSSAVLNTGSGTVKLSGAALTSEKFYAVYNQLSSGKLEITGGTVSSDSSHAVVNYGRAEISGGSVTSQTGVAVLNSAGGSSLTVSGGTVHSPSGQAISNYGSGNTVTITGGAVSTDSGTAISNFSTCALSLSGGTVSSQSGTSIVNGRGGNAAISDGATVSSVSGTAVYTSDSLAITGGTVSAVSSVALISDAPAGSEVTVSGGTISSTSAFCAGNSGAGKMTISGTAALNTGGNTCLLNYGAGTVAINGGTLTAAASELYNAGTGKLEINAGTYKRVVNSSAAGSVVINGGSVKAVQGATPVNSDGTALSRYGITISVANTPVSAEELTLTPAVVYSFVGMKTDETGTVYLWLPAATAASYHSGDIDVSGGITAGKTSVLPNFTARVTAQLDGEIWDNPSQVLLSTSASSLTCAIISDGNSAQEGGVYVFSGLTPGKTYYIWGTGTTGMASSGVQVTRDDCDVTVNYYSLTVAAGGGIDSVFSSGTYIQGSTAPIQAAVKSGYTFEKWANTVGGEQVLAAAAGSILMDGTKALTATATLNTYTGTVTVKKDGSPWSNSGKTVTLSPLADSETAAGYQSLATDADGVYSFANLSPLADYYIWTDGTCTGQTVTPSGKDAAVDYYTVSLTKGANIASVQNGDVYRKGTEITVSATVNTGDYVFSRWQNTTGGALVSTESSYTFTVNGEVSLTAVGGAARYDATVTLKKNNADWSTSPRAIMLSTSDTSLVGTVTVTASGNIYTFAGLSGAGVYYIWDKETMTYTGKTIDSAMPTATLDYYTVTVNGSENVASVTGAGTYLKASTVTVTAVPDAYYRITGAGWTSGTYTIDGIDSEQALTAAAEFDIYTGTVNLNKNDAPWTDATANVALSTSHTNIAENQLTTTGADGVYSFANLNPTQLYYIWADGTYTGQTMSSGAKTATVDYYTVEVTETGVTVIGDGPYLKGSNVTLTATPTGALEFAGWYAGTTLLATSAAYTLYDLRAGQALTAKAASTFDATVTVTGATGRTINLSTSYTSLTEAVSSTGSGPYTFSGLTLGSTYYVFDNGKYTGRTVTKNAPNVTLRYYTVSLAPGAGIDSVSGGGAYLAGSNVTVRATADTGHAFSGWSDGSTENPHTITGLSGDLSLTANAVSMVTAGPLNIADGPIVIEDDTDHAGKIRIKQNGDIISGSNNLDPSINIIITGATTNSANYVSVTATRGVYMTLNGVSISGTYLSGVNGCINIADTAGNVTINLEGTNILTGGNSRAGIYKGMGSNTLTITGSGSLTAVGGRNSAGIGGYAYASGGNNVIIAGGSITATGDGGAGIGGGLYNASGTITITGGTVIATSTTGNGGAGIGGGSGGGGNSGPITITGGTVTATGNYNSAGIGGGGGQGVGNSGPITITGGTVTATSNGIGSGIGAGGNPNNQAVGTTGTIKITGGNIKATSTSGAAMGATPVGSNGASLTYVEETWSDSLNIVDNRGIAYGMNDVTAIDGKMYAYVDRSTYLAIATPASAMENGIMASAAFSPTRASSGDIVTVTVTLSGTAQRSGTFTVGLTGVADISTTTSPNTFSVTKGQPVTESPAFTFSFNMPASAVTSLAVTLSFAETVIASHTVSYYDGSTLLGSAAYYEGETYALMSGAGLTKTGYTFGGWGVSGIQTMGTSDVIHTAGWTPNTYQVVFHDGGTTATQSFTYGTEATALNNGSFTKTGSTLSGWATTQNGPKVYAVGETVQNLSSSPGGSVDLYAIWQEQSYIVSFEGGGATGVAMTPQSFTYNATQELTPNTFTREGYTFNGWQKDVSTTYVNGQSVTVTGNMTLTAQWTANSYGVAFVGNGATAGSMAQQPFTYGVPQNLATNAFTREGYTFAGWNTAPGGGASYTSGQSVSNLTAVNNGTVTLYARWTANTYTVAFNPGTGGSGTMSNQTHTYDTTLALTANAFTRPGYSFAGWNTQEGGSGLSYSDGAAVKNLATTGNVTLYAQWTADTYSLAFNANSGVGSMENQTFATGDNGTVSANRFAKPGYTFNGWNTQANGSGANYAEAATLMSLNDLADTPLPLYAKWTANNFTVSFYSSGGTGAMSSQSFTYDTAQSLTPNTFTRVGYTFRGWSTSPAAETATYTNGQSVSNLSSVANATVALYAVWQANTYEVRFDANGGSGDMLPQTIDRGTATALNTNTYTRSGSRFSSWNTVADGSGIRYAGGQQVTNLPGDTSASITLYAQWTEDTRYDLDGTVRDSSSAALSGATVELKQGSVTVAQTSSMADGTYFFGNLQPGVYNLVAAKDGKTVTVLLTISANTTQDVGLPTASNNSVLVVTGEPAVEVPKVVVGGLDAVAAAESANITMTVTAKAEAEGDTEQLAIREESGSRTVGLYLDMTVHSGSTPLTATANVLEIVIPFQFAGKTSVQVMRYHGAVAEKLEQLSQRPTVSFTDKTCFLDTQAGLIYVYASKFSTYAVAYTVNSGSSSGVTSFPVGVNTAGVSGGSVRADQTTAVPGAKVTITVTPDEGYILTGLSIIDANGEEIQYTDNGDGTYTFTMPGSRVTVTPAFGSADSAFPFVDVPKTHWAHGAIAWAYENGLFSGLSATTFGPGISTTRGMVVTVLWRMEKEPSVTQDTVFADVAENAYYGKAVAWANENGVVLGYGNGLFGPEDTITREQMAAILYRYAQLKGMDVGKGVSLDQFTDGGKTAGYAKAAMEWAVANNLITGKGNGILYPNGAAARAEVAVMLMRFSENAAK